MRFPRIFYLILFGLALGLLLSGTAAPLHAQVSVPAEPPDPPEQAPFGLPFAGDPGLSTWYIVQWYGNTTFAYHWRNYYYEAGQGLHFGLDFSVRCGTEIQAIGDGVVAYVDETRFGSGPHNLIIDHQNGFSSLYGHLLERSSLKPGQPVSKGDVIGLSGDPDGTCDSRPHLHLEIRDESYHYAYNPVIFIDADWDTLALFGPMWGFQQDLTAPRRWVTPTDQPPVDFWSGTLNDYAYPWPPDWLQE